MKFDKTKIYISTVAEDAGDVALEYGFGLEIAEFCTAANMDGDFPKWDALVREKLAGIARRMMHAPFNELYPAAIEPRVYEVARARYREAAALAGTYGVNRMVVHSGYVPLIYFKEYFHERAVAFWRELLGDLPDDFTLLLENVLDDGPELLAGIVREIADPRFRLCLDIGHANTVVSDVPITRWIDASAPYVGHLHIH
ncbi:MAG: TIM barrel protein, partial [Clostridiales bacterium]|nr:TIM barrel protein [Clostridiales bacterium]